MKLSINFKVLWDSLDEAKSAKNVARTCIHSGNAGDIIYSLPTVKELGAKHYIINLNSDPAIGGRGITFEAAKALAPLLLAQSYIERVTIVRCNVFLEYLDPDQPMEGIDYILDRFRLQDPDKHHLAISHAMAFGIHVNLYEKWLYVGVEEKIKDYVIVALTPRYRSLPREFWVKVLSGLDNIILLGIPREFYCMAGINGDFVTCKDFLEMAKIINGSKLFIGNPSLPYAIAEGLKIPRLVELPYQPRNAYPIGKNGYVVPNSIKEARMLIEQLVSDSKEKKVAYIHRQNQTYEILDGSFLKASIIIPVFNKLEYTKQCIKALYDNTPIPLFELIIVNNASTDGTKEYLDQLSQQVNNIKVIHNQENLGFAKACNQGARIAEGRYLVFLNNDTVPLKGWLDALIETIEKDEKIGAVGTKLIYPDGRLQEAGSVIFNDGTGWNFGKGDEAHKDIYNEAYEVDYCSGACLLVRKDLFWKIGGFDERYSPAYYEDTDLCFALRKLGYKVVYCPRCEVIHFEGVTINENIHKDFKTMQIETKRQDRRYEREKDKEIIINTPKMSIKGPILVIGVYLANQKNNVRDIVSEFNNSLEWNVTQKWIAIGGDPPNDEIRKVTVQKYEKYIPKFVLVNKLLSRIKLDNYHFLLISDDDIILPSNFLDQFLEIQMECDFAIAQPARSHNSYVDHVFVEQLDGLKARRTRFVEIGPLVSFRHDIFSLIFPFDERSPMGWGYDFVWPYLLEKKGLRMGIIDATPVDHSMRKPVANYIYKKAKRDMELYLLQNPHLSKEEAFRILESYV